jgi:carbamoyltransferase
MRVVGISPLDKDATVSVVEDGRILFAAAEERFSRRKQHAGFPNAALELALKATGTRAEDVDQVAYAFLPADQETALMQKNIAAAAQTPPSGDWRAKLRAAGAYRPNRSIRIPGLANADQAMRKDSLKAAAYWLFGIAPGTADWMARRTARNWLQQASSDHRHWQGELESGLARFGLAGKLKRYEHHLAHAANAYLVSGFDRALIVTLDGYGTGLAGSISLGEGGSIKRLQNITFPHSLGMFYENVTAALGFKPDRHAGKIVGLAAYGDPSVLREVIETRFQQQGNTFAIYQSFNYFFERHLATNFPMIDLAAAYQQTLEVVAAGLVRHWVAQTGCDAVVLSGGVIANVKMNQRIFEVEGVRRIFIYPNMGDGGCGTGLALLATWRGGVGTALNDAYLGPSYGEDEVLAALKAEGLEATRPNNLAAEIARLIHEDRVVARCDGRMEYGPRALGNRSILYNARDPEVNQWLNKRLRRTEFMPFAPVTLWEERERCYVNLAGAEHAAQFMTITFDCTDFMRRTCPAAVHVDGTARPQLIRREVNPDYYDIVDEYRKLSGVPTLINTSFNMHEEPIVCTPQDAVRAFLDGDIDVLAVGGFLVHHPKKVRPGPG